MAQQQDTRSLVEKFVSELRAVIQMDALDVVRTALGEGAPKRRERARPRPVQVAKPTPGRPPRAGARRGRGRKAGGRVRRSAADLERTSARVLAYVRSNAGQRLEEIGQGLRTATAGLKRPIQVLVAAGKLRTEGQKRGTRYFAGGRRRKVAKRKVAKKVRRSKARKAKVRKARVRMAKRKARKAPLRRERVVAVRPQSKRKTIAAKGTQVIALEAVPEAVLAATASEPT